MPPVHAQYISTSCKGPGLCRLQQRKHAEVTLQPFCCASIGMHCGRLNKQMTRNEEECQPLCRLWLQSRAKIENSLNCRELHSPTFLGGNGAQQAFQWSRHCWATIPTASGRHCSDANVVATIYSQCMCRSASQGIQMGLLAMMPPFRCYMTGMNAFGFRNSVPCQLACGVLSA